MTKKKSLLTLFDWVMIAGTTAAIIIFAYFSMGFREAFTSADWLITSIAAVLNICCCVCSAKGSKWTFIFGAVYNILYTYYCFSTAHYGNAAVYGLCFLPLQFVGWFQWRRIGAAGETEQVAAKRLSWKQRAYITAISIAIMVGLWFLLKALGGQDIEVDAMCTVLCVIAQLLLTFAYMEQWFIWIGVNLLTLTMWMLSAISNIDAGQPFVSDLNLVICYAFVLVNSLNGLRVWLRLSR